MANSYDYDESFSSDDEAMLESVLSEGRWEESSDDDTEALPRYRRGPTALPMRPRPFRPVSGIAGANIQTPAGRAQVQFGKPVVTQDAVNELARGLKAEIAGVAASVKKVNETLDKNTAMLDKKVNTVSAALKKTQQQAQMMALLPMLLSKPPKLLNLTTSGADGSVTTQTWEKADTLTTMLPLMLMGDFAGQGGESGSNMMMMMMVMAIALSDKDSK